MRVWRTYTDLFKGTTGALVLSVFIALLQAALMVPIALLVRRVLNETIPAGDGTGLLLTALFILGLHLAESGLSLCSRYVTLTITKAAVQRLRSGLLYRLYRFSRRHYAQADHGTLHTNIVQDTERLDIMTNGIITHLIPATIVSVALVGLLLYLNWQLAIACFGVAPLLLLAGRTLGRRLRARVQAFNRDFEKFSEGVMFALKTMDLSRVCAAEDKQLLRHQQHIESLRVSSRTMAWFQSAYSLIQSSITTIAAVFVLVAGGLLVIRGSMNFGDLVSFYIVLAFLRAQTGFVLFAIPQILAGHESLVALSAWDDRFDEPPYSGTRSISLSRGVELADVSFGYDSQPVLRNVSLRIDLGRSALLTGPSGAGKSTLVNLILGMYRPLQGRVMADGVPYDELDLTRLRQQLGVVMQDPVVFAGTVAENIAYARPDAGRPEIEEAARLACAHGFIEELPRGYDTDVGERGVLLSGGQRQRLAIARAWLVKPALLILDEPTNHMDYSLAREVLANMSAGRDRPTLLLVSHDERLAEITDVVFRIDGGTLREIPRTREMAQELS